MIDSNEKIDVKALLQRGKYKAQADCLARHFQRAETVGQLENMRGQADPDCWGDLPTGKKAPDVFTVVADLLEQHEQAPVKRGSGVVIEGTAVEAAKGGK